MQLTINAKAASYLALAIVAATVATIMASSLMSYLDTAKEAAKIAGL